jgi:hypothetical protein
VDGVTRAEKKLKATITARYGYITLFGSLLIIALIPMWRRLALRLKLKIEWRTHIACIITGWLLFSTAVTFAESYGDLLVIAKRLGRVSATLMPALLLLTLRPSPLPKTLYLTLLPIHKWLSRIVVLEGALHTVLYLFYLDHTGTTWKIWKPVNIYGIVAMAAFLLIAISSLPRVRRIAFKTFYFTHYIMTWVSVIALHFHARPGIPYVTALDIVILTSQIAYRLYYTESVKLTVTPISPTLALVEFPTEAIKKKMVLPVGHVRINNKHRGLKWAWYNLVPLQHPFTVSSLPNDKAAKLIVRRGEFPLVTNKQYDITGGFEPEIPFIETPRRNTSRQPLLGGMIGSPMYYSISAERVLIIVGGSGISFGLPLYRLLNYNGIAVRLIWVCKDIRDLNVLNWYRGIQGIECYVTGENDIEVDYYDDLKHGVDEQTVEYYGSVDDDASEIDFTTLGREYKEAHNLGSSPLSPLSCLSPHSSQPQAGYAPSQPKRVPIMKLPKSALLPHSAKSFLDKPSTTSLNFHENVHISTSGQCSYHATPPHLAHLPRSEIPEFQKLKLPASVRIFSGRPNLGAEDYAWCTQTACVGPRVEDGRNVCCRDVIDDGLHRNISKDKIWVIGAGPQGLVDEAGDWAKEGGLRWHGESFSI